MNAPGILEADSVRYRVSGRRILTNVYLKVAVGEILGILGRNGAGKSVLLKIIFGVLPCESRNIRLNGKQCGKPFATKTVSYLPQKGLLPPSGKVSAMIDLFLDNPAAAGVAKSEERISAHLDKRVRELSGGLRRYLEVLLILNLGSSFVLLDEPFSGIEPIYRERIKQWIKEASKTKGILITDHDYLNILDLTSDIALISKGSLIPIRDPEELKDYGFIPMHAVLKRRDPMS